MRICGIDPGFTGAICIIDTTMHTLIEAVHDMPVIRAKKQELSLSEVRAILEDGISHVFLEKSQAMPGQGISSTARYMDSFGQIKGLCCGLQIPLTLVHPRTWKTELMKDMPKEKEASILRVQQLYPHVDLHRKKDHGRADAILIATYGMNQLNSQTKQK